MKKPLVSIITPCLNGEKFLDRYFNSILLQTYDNIELFFVNDGSTDRTEEIALSYKDKLEKKGISYHYIYQTNQGHSAVLNKCLKLVTGKYLSWPDSDDVMLPKCIENKVSYLENNKDCGLVFCKGRQIDEITGKQMAIVGRVIDGEDVTLFEDLIFDNNICTYPVGSMIRMEEFVKYNPQKEIYTQFKGQNFQMLLPFAYFSKIGYISDILYEYYYRNESESHKYTKSYKTWIARMDGLENAKIKTILTINPENENEILQRLRLYYARKRLNIAVIYGNKHETCNAYNQIKQNSKPLLKEKILFYAGTNTVLNMIYRIFRVLLYTIVKRK